MKSHTLILSTILTLCQLSPTLQNETSYSSTKNYDLAPLYLLFSNYLTVSMTEVLKHLTEHEFQQKTTLGFVSTNSHDCNGNTSLIPVYRFHDTTTSEYILSTNPSRPTDTTLPYTPDSIAFYASDTLNEQCGFTVPLHSYWHHIRYVYTTDKTSADAVLVKLRGGTYKGIVCYISPNEKPPVTTELPTTTRRTTTPPTTTVPTTTAPTTTRRTTTRRTTTVPTTTVPPAPNCPVNLVTLWRLSSPGNHFYTTSELEANIAVTAYGYVRQDSPVKVAKSATDCSCENRFVPIHRLYKTGRFDFHNFYTANEEEVNTAGSMCGYNRQSIAFYCSPTKDLCGATVPLHRYSRISDFEDVMPYDGTYQEILCYIWPN